MQVIARKHARNTGCLAERGGFEPSRPFISRMLPRFHAHSFLRKIVDVKVGPDPGVVSKDWL